jgi:hypothetical protein
MLRGMDFSYIDLARCAITISDAATCAPAATAKASV